MINGAVPVETVLVICPVALIVVNAPVLAVVAPTVPLMLIDAVPVNPVAAPLNDVALKTPVFGTKLSLVELVVTPVFPVVTAEIVGYQVETLEVLSVIATFVAFVAFVADPTDNVLCATYWGADAPAVST